MVSAPGGLRHVKRRSRDDSDGDKSGGIYVIIREEVEEGVRIKDDFTNTIDDGSYYDYDLGAFALFGCGAQVTFLFSV